MKHVTAAVLWALVALYFVETLVRTVAPQAVPVSVSVLLLVAFALIHGGLRYGTRGILVFVAICLVVSNSFENLSILTGFPFGHYYYTDGLGPKLFLVPLLIGPAYVSVGYLAWVLANILVGDARGKSMLATFSVPFIAAFLMVLWDLCLDPTSSTVEHNWIWQDGGGYFGVPLSNYLGWLLTTYVFFQLFALYVGTSGVPKAAFGLSSTRVYRVQAVVMYATVGVGFVLQFLAGAQGQVTDAAGATWPVASISETAAIVSIFTMLFVAVLSLVTIVQADPNESRIGVPDSAMGRPSAGSLANAGARR